MLRGEFAIRLPQSDPLSFLQQEREGRALIHQHLRVVTPFDELAGPNHERVDEFRHPLDCLFHQRRGYFPQ